MPLIGIYLCSSIFVNSNVLCIRKFVAPSHPKCCTVLFIILTMNEVGDNKLVVGTPFIVQCNAIMRVEYEAQKLCMEMHGRVIWCNGDDDRDRDNDHEENEFPCRWCRNKPCFVYIYEAGMVAWWTQQNWIITWGIINPLSTQGAPRDRRKQSYNHFRRMTGWVGLAPICMQSFIKVHLSTMQTTFWFRQSTRYTLISYNLTWDVIYFIARHTR